MNQTYTIPRRRRVTNVVALGLCGAALGLAVIVLLAVLGYVVVEGASSLSLTFLTGIPQPVGETGGGMGNAIVGTLLLVTIALVIGLPIGIGTGIYLAEYGRGRFATAVRFVSDVLTGIPSITIGLFAYALLVVPLKTFSALSGGFALGILMLPLVTRTTEEMVRLVPASLREAAIALGIPQWKVVIQIVLPAARSGIITAVLLAVARVAGETAPLLFTAFGNEFWNWNLMHPTAAMPLQIFSFAIAPYEDWHRQAWAGALVLVSMILMLNLGARLVARRRTSGG